MRYNTQITNIDAIANGRTSTARLDVNRRYHGLKLLTFSDGVAAAADTIVDKIRLIVGSKTIREITAGDLLSIAQLNGVAVVAGELPIYFSEPWRASVMAEEATSWPMFGVNSFTLQVDLLANVGHVSTFDLRGFWDKLPNLDQNGKPFLEIIKQLSQTAIIPAGESTINTIDIDHFIHRILMRPIGAATIDKVRVDRDGETIHELNSDENTRLLKDYKLDATAFAYPLVFDYTQQITDAMTVANSLQLKITPSAGDTLNILVERRVQSYA